MFVKKSDYVSSIVNLVEKNTDNRFIAYLVILKLLKLNGFNEIADNHSYPFKAADLSYELDKLFSFELKKEFTSDEVIWITFPAGFLKAIKEGLLNNETVSLEDIYRVFNFDNISTSTVSSDNYGELFPFTTEQLQSLFHLDGSVIAAEDREWTKDSIRSQVIRKLNFEEEPEKLHVSFSGSNKSTVSSPGELKRGPYFQPLYGSFQMNECAILSSFNLSEKYYISYKNQLNTTKPLPVVNSVGSSSTKSLETYNCIYYGPPGTGKTKLAQYLSSKILAGEQIESDIPQIELLGQDEVDLDNINFYATQFHPSFSYEDFIEGLRPITVQKQNGSDVTYLVTPGVFKVVSELARAIGQPGEFGIEIDVQFIKNDSVSYWEIGENSLVSSYRLTQRRGYFMMGDEKVLEVGNETALGMKQPETTGVYKLTWFSASGQNSNFVLLIDELNRGNPSAVFGEALSLIETTKRIGPGQKEQTFLTLPYSKKKFGVPKNLHIICAMNSSDKSLVSIDQAFRRRFKFHYAAPDFSILTSPKFNEVLKRKGLPEFEKDHLKEIKSFFEIINKSLKDTGISEDNFIGHSYAISFLSRSAIVLKNQKVNPETKIANEKKVITEKFQELWKKELHSLLRDIVGEFKLEEFSTNLCTNLSKVGETKIFGPIDNNFHKHLKEFLFNPSAKEEAYPWKQAS